MNGRKMMEIIFCYAGEPTVKLSQNLNIFLYDWDSV